LEKFLFLNAEVNGSENLIYLEKGKAGKCNLTIIND